MNLATERATVAADPAVADAPIVAAISAAGYDVRPETAATSPLEDDPRFIVRSAPGACWSRRCVIAVALALMVMMFCRRPRSR